MEISGNIMLLLAFCPRMFNQMRDPSMRSSSFRRSTLPCLLIRMSALTACAGTSGLEAAHAAEASSQMAMANLQQHVGTARGPAQTIDSYSGVKLSNHDVNYTDET